MKISIITPTLPEKSDFLINTSKSIDILRKKIIKNIEIEWIISVDWPWYISNIDDLKYDKIIYTTSRKWISAARNIALFNSEWDYIIPIDADDTFNTDWFIEIIEKIYNWNFLEYWWIGLNRKLTDWSKTPHWNSSESKYKKWEFSKEWSAPFKFHPNTLIIKSDIAKLIWWWPAIIPNEDLAFVLLLSEKTDWIILTTHFINYRIWEKQTINELSYLPDKKIAFKVIESYINTIRKYENKKSINAPESWKAFWKVKK